MNLKSKSFVILAFASIGFAAQQATVVSTTDWKLFETKDGKFAIKAPKAWGKADPNDPSTKDAMEKIKANNPNLAKMVESQDNQFALYMFDFGGDAAKGLNNMNLKVLADTGMTSAMYPDVASAILKQTGMKNSGNKVIDLPAGKALTYWGDLPVALGEGKSMDFKVYGFMIVKENMTYICTMTTTPAQDKVEKPIFEAMAKSIVLK